MFRVDPVANAIGRPTDIGSVVRSLSIVLPAYNEEASIEDAVRACAGLAEAASDFEVIVVDDGSQDDTAGVIKQLVDELSWLRLVSHDRNRGYGAALRTGFAAARHDLVFYTDADQQFEVGELRDHLHRMDSVDLLTGFRVYRYDPLSRLVVSWVYNRMVRVLFRVEVRDVDCSFKLMRRERLDRLVLLSDDFFIDTELVARARKWKWTIEQVGVRHFPRRKGKTSVRPSAVTQTLRTLASMWREIYFPNRRRLVEAIEEQDTLRADMRG